MSKKQILIVEDDKSLSTVMTEKFINDGFDVLEAHDGLEGLELAIEKHPDLIIFDIAMPKMDSLTALKKLRADNWGENVPVIILTNITDASRVDEALQAGAFDCLIKSDWDLKDIVQKVKDKLK